MPRCAVLGLSSIEQLGPEGFLLFVVALWRILALLRGVGLPLIGQWRRGVGLLLAVVFGGAVVALLVVVIVIVVAVVVTFVGLGALDDLVEFAAVEPDASALGAVVDLDALSVGHDQGEVATGTIHHQLLSSK